MPPYLATIVTLAGHNGDIFQPRDTVPVQGWLTKHWVFTSALDRLHRQLAHTDDPFQPLANFKSCVQKAKQEASRTLPRNHLPRMERSF